MICPALNLSPFFTKTLTSFPGISAEIFTSRYGNVVPLRVNDVENESCLTFQAFTGMMAVIFCGFAAASILLLLLASTKPMLAISVVVIVI